MSSALDMLKRFREAEPSSRAERESARAAGEVQEMWWNRDNRSTTVGQQPPAASLDYSRNIPASSAARHSLDIDESIGTNFGMRSSRPPPGSANPYAQLTSIDDLITREIQNLEREVINDPTRSVGGVDVNIRQSSDGFEGLGMGTGISLSDSRDFMRRSQGQMQNRAGTDPLADLRLSGDYFKSSVDTLGSTGFKALLYPEMKLDGMAEEKNADIELASGVDEGATADDVLARAKSMLAELNKENSENTSFDGRGLSNLNAIAANLEADMKGLMVMPGYL